jgi:hypothetical protein
MTQNRRRCGNEIACCRYGTEFSHGLLNFRNRRSTCPQRVSGPSSNVRTPPKAATAVPTGLNRRIGPLHRSNCSLPSWPGHQAYLLVSDLTPPYDDRPWSRTRQFAPRPTIASPGSAAGESRFIRNVLLGLVVRWMRVYETLIRFPQRRLAPEAPRSPGWFPSKPAKAAVLATMSGPRITPTVGDDCPTSRLAASFGGTER